MSSENCQDFEVKYINDAWRKCVCIRKRPCMRVCVCVLQRRPRGSGPVTVTVSYRHYDHYLSSGYHI